MLGFDARMAQAVTDAHGCLLMRMKDAIYGVCNLFFWLFQTHHTTKINGARQGRWL
jgi:hypothetical protein